MPEHPSDNCLERIAVLESQLLTLKEDIRDMHTDFNSSYKSIEEKINSTNSRIDKILANDMSHKVDRDKRYWFDIVKVSGLIHAIAILLEQLWPYVNRLIFGVM